MFESIAHARQCYDIAANAEREASKAKNTQIAELCKATRERILAAAIAQFAQPNVHNCGLCDRYFVLGGPKHVASKFCESGKRDHCSCDMCF